jgi:SH3 domain-containing YSC84-like protein 1
MKRQYRSMWVALVAVQALALGSVGSPALAKQKTATEQGAAGNTAASAAYKHVDDAAAAVQRMASEPGMDKLLAQAKGIYIIPSYGRAALGLGASGGAGVFLARKSDGSWTDPSFYNTGGLSIGLQAGAEAGPIAFILLNDKAVAGFKQKNKFNLSADAGLTVVDWSKTARGSAGNGDVVAWSGSKGLFGNVATIGLNDVRFNAKATQAYYGKPTSAAEVMSGAATNAHGDALKKALGGSAGKP